MGSSADMVARAESSAAKLRMFAIRAEHNHQAMLTYLGVLLGIGFIVIVSHFARIALRGSRQQRNQDFNKSTITASLR